MTVALGLVTAFAWALANLFTQQVSRQRLEPAVVMFWVLVVTSAVVVPLALVLDRGAGPWTLRDLAWPVGAGLLADVGFFLLLRALSVGSLSVVAPIIAVEGGVAAALSIVLGERPSPLELGLLGVAVVGAVLVALEPGRRTAAGAIPAALAAIVYAGALIGIGMSDFPEVTTVAITRVTSVLAILPVFVLLASRRIPPAAARVPIIGCGILDAVGFAAFAFAAAIGPLSVASVTATQWGTAAALIGIVFLRERLHPNQYVGIAVTLAAITALGLVG